MASDTVAVSSRSPRSMRTVCTPAAGQKAWMMYPYTPVALISPGVQSPGSMPPSTVGS